MAGLLTNPKFRRIALIAAGAIILVLILISVFFQDALFRMSITPPGRFGDEKQPARPDYSQPAAWAIRPDQPPPGAWESPWGVDIFFIHPASAYSNTSWNVAIDDKDALARLKDSILPNHAGPFLQAGPVYAPLYRQAALHSEIDVGGEGDGALLLAYEDVLRAFDQYVLNDNRSRGIIIAGVGQGGLYAQRLLADRFQAPPLKDRLAAAYIIDAALPADFPGGTVGQPLCISTDDIHCVVGWKSIIAGEGEDRFRNQSPVWTVDWKIATSKGRKLACINPMRWSPSAELAPMIDHRGAARATGATDLDPHIIPKALTARCRDGVLDVEHPSAPELQAEGGAGAQYKTPPFNLFYADIVPNVAGRMKALTAWLDNPDNARKPAEPMGPSVPLIDAPIHRPSGEPELPH